MVLVFIVLSFLCLVSFHQLDRRNLVGAGKYFLLRTVGLLDDVERSAVGQQRGQRNEQ